MGDFLWRSLCFFLAFILVLESYLLVSAPPSTPVVVTRRPLDAWDFDPIRDSDNHGLTKEQCEHAFPDLFYEIDRAVAYWRSRAHKISKEDVELDWRRDGMFKALVYNNQLRIVDVKRAWIPNPYGKRTFYMLSSLYRALLGASTIGERLPNIEFSGTLDDMSTIKKEGTNTVWAFCRRIGDGAEEKTWIMPDFQYFASPPYAGSFGEMQQKARFHDEPLRDKIPKLVWRGRSGTSKNVRGELIDVTQGKDWADVKATGFGVVDQDTDMISMDNLCRYQFVAHTEGRSWSGRLKYLLNCRSVPVIHKLHWTAEVYHLLKPDGPDQNYIEVERDWSDLEQKMKYYLDHPDEAQRIADNVVKTFRDRYNTPAAESCYWRAMVRGFSEVSFEPEPLETVPVNISGVMYEQKVPRGWSYEKFIWNDDKAKVGWRFDGPSEYPQR